MSEFTRRRDLALIPYYNASLQASPSTSASIAPRILAHLAANREQWAADEMVRFAQMANGENPFPSFRFARLMARSGAAV